MNSPRTVEDLRSRRRAILRLALGQLQVIGAMAALVLLLQGGVSKPAIWTALFTGIVALTSILLFRIAWREKRKPKQEVASVRGIFHWPRKM
jgi:hypothetical protein